jgi:hypothetical protein
VYYLPDADDQGMTPVSFPVVLLCALIAIACLQWLPAFSFFFAVPLFVLYFLYGERYFAYSVAFTFCSSILVSVLTMIVFREPLDAGSIVSACAGSGFFLLPSLFVLGPRTLRVRYRIVLAGLACAAAWALFVMNAEVRNALTGFMKDISSETSKLLCANLPDGFEADQLRVQFSPDALYTMISDLLLFTVIPTCVLMYAVDFMIARFVARKISRYSVPAWRISAFYADFAVFIPLVVGMCGIMLARLLDNKVLAVLSWNAALVAGIFFLAQGTGILDAYLQYLARIRRISPLGTILFLAIFFFLGGWIFLVLVLLIAGVVELFVPIRARFSDKGIVDPTPGRGIDQK